MTLRKSMFSMLFVALAATPWLAAQRPMMPRYNPANEISLKGTIDEVRQVTHQRMTGVHLMVKTDAGVVTVVLGPQAFLDRSQFTVAKGDQVEITGAKSELNGAPIVIAREIKKGDQTLALRDSQGIPKWSGDGAAPTAIKANQHGSGAVSCRGIEPWRPLSSGCFWCIYDETAAQRGFGLWRWDTAWKPGDPEVAHNSQRCDGKTGWPPREASILSSFSLSSLGVDHRDRRDVHDLVDLGAALQDVHRLGKPGQDRPDGIGATQTRQQFVGDIASLQIREDQHVGATLE